MSKRTIDGPRQNFGTYHSQKPGGARIRFVLQGYYGFSAQSGWLS